MTQSPSASTTTATAGYLFRVALAGTALIAVFVTVDALISPAGTSLKREGGGLEVSSVVLQLLAAATFFAVVPSRFWAPLFHLPALFVLFAAREMDFDKAFTQSGILSLRFYSGDSSLTAKLIGGAFALFAVYVVFRSLRRGLPAMWRALQEREVWPWFAIMAAVLIVFVKAMDGLGRKLRDFGIEISEDLNTLASTVEEIGEAFLPVIAILALIACWKGRQT